MVDLKAAPFTRHIWQITDDESRQCGNCAWDFLGELKKLEFNSFQLSVVGGSKTDVNR